MSWCCYLPPKLAYDVQLEFQNKACWQLVCTVRHIMTYWMLLTSSKTRCLGKFRQKNLHLDSPTLHELRRKYFWSQDGMQTLVSAVKVLWRTHWTTSWLSCYLHLYTRGALQQVTGYRQLPATDQAAEFVTLSVRTTGFDSVSQSVLWLLVSNLLDFFFFLFFKIHPATQIVTMTLSFVMKEIWIHLKQQCFASWSQTDATLQLNIPSVSCLKQGDV